MRRGSRRSPCRCAGAPRRGRAAIDPFMQQRRASVRDLFPTKLADGRRGIALRRRARTPARQPARRARLSLAAALPRPASGEMAASHPHADARSLWGENDRLLAAGLWRRRGSARSPARGTASSAGLRPSAASRESRTSLRGASPISAPTRALRHENLQFPSDALCRRRSRRDREERLRLGHLSPTAITTRVKGAELYNQYLDQLETADALGFDGVVRQRASSDRLWHDADAGRAGRRAAARIKNGKIAILGRALPLVDNPLVIAEEFAILDNITRGKIIAGFVRGIGAEYHSMGVNPTESQERFHGGARSHRARLDRARPVRLRRQVLQFRIRQSVAAALSEAASADLDPVLGLVQHDPMGGEEALYLLPDAGADRPGGAYVPDSSARRRTRPAIRPRPTSSPGRTRSMSPRPTPKRSKRRSRISRPMPIISSRPTRR